MTTISELEQEIKHLWSILDEERNYNRHLHGLLIKLEARIKIIKSFISFRDFAFLIKEHPEAEDWFND